jgi:hypothetical protein
VVDICPQPEPEMPGLVNQDECSVSSDGGDSVNRLVGSDGPLPVLIPQHDDDVSSAGCDSATASSNSDNEFDDIVLESAFGAQITFIDDNNNVVTVGDEISEYHEANLAADALSHIELSNIAIKHSNSKASDDDTPIGCPNIPDPIKEEDRKPAALSLNSGTLLPPKIPNNKMNVSNEEVLQWLEHHNPFLADSSAQEFKVYTTKPTCNIPKSKLHPRQGPCLTSNDFGAFTYQWSDR